MNTPTYIRPARNRTRNPLCRCSLQRQFTMGNCPVFDSLTRNSASAVLLGCTSPTYALMCSLCARSLCRKKPFGEDYGLDTPSTRTPSHVSQLRLAGFGSYYLSRCTLGEKRSGTVSIQKDAIAICRICSPVISGSLYDGFLFR